MGKRAVLNETERKIMDRIKQLISIGIEDLREEVRHANIEIELIHHIRNELSKESE